MLAVPVPHSARWSRGSRTATIHPSGPQGCDYTSWQGWQDHIVAELLRIASEGLPVISDTIWPEEYLRVELMNIRETFTDVK